MTFFICVFVLLMQFLWKYIDELVGKGLEWDIITELLIYASVGTIPLAFPLAMLLASIMTFGNLGENYELVAMKSSGISLFRIMRPLMVLTFSIVALAFYFSNNILPKANLKLYSLLLSVREQNPEMIIKEGVFANDIENFSIKVGKKGENGMLYELMIYNHSNNDGNVNVTLADSGTMEFTSDKKFMMITLFSGHSYTDVKENKSFGARKYPFRRETFSKEIINISVTDFEFNRIDEKRFSNSAKMMNLQQLKGEGDTLFIQYKERLWRFISSLNYSSEIGQQLAWEVIPQDSLAVAPDFKPDTIVDVDLLIAKLNTHEKNDLYTRAASIVRSNTQTISQQAEELYRRKEMLNLFSMEWHRKFTLSFACLIFFFIGAPLGAIIRKGGLGMPVVVSVLMFIVYYIFSITGEKFAREDAWSIVGGMWLSSYLFLPLGIWLTYKAANDSAVMNVESYQLFFKRIFSRLKAGRNVNNSSQ